MDDMYTKCLNCGFPKREHRAKYFNCPSEEIPGRKVYLDNSIFISSSQAPQVEPESVITSVSSILLNLHI